MKKIIAIIIPFITFFAGISVYYAHDINGAFNIYSNGEQGEYTIGGFTYAYYDYTCSNCNNNSPSTAYCLDAHVQFGGSGNYYPALEDSHSQNYYQYYLDTGSQEFPRGMINIGQELVDNYSSYSSKVAVQIALRFWFYQDGWNLNSEFSYNGGAKYYNFFKTLTNKDADGVPNETKSLLEKASNSPYTMNAKDGFDYENGFWEARYVKTDTDDYPGLEEVGNNKYTYNAMFKTNIRFGSFTEENINYDRDNFTCEVSEKSEELQLTCNNDNCYKGVAWVNCKTKDGVEIENPNFSFEINYQDPREASNFWQVYHTNNGTSKGPWDKRQRMYVIEKNWSNLTIVEGNIPDNIDKPSFDFCNVDLTDQVCNPVDADKYEFWVGNADINECILKQLNTTTTTNYAGENAETYGTKTNEYCKTAEAEDYKFTMPTLKSAVAGTYFKFNNSNGEDITDDDEIQIMGRVINTSRINLEKFYLDMYGNSEGIISVAESYKLNSRPALNYSIGNSTVAEARSDYSSDGGLNQEIIDYQKLGDFLEILQAPGSYTASISDRCKKMSVFGGCAEYYKNYTLNSTYSSSYLGYPLVIKEEEWTDYVSSLSDASDDCTNKENVLISLVTRKVNSFNECTTSVDIKEANLNPTIVYNYAEPVYTGKVHVEQNHTKKINDLTIFCKQNLEYINNGYVCSSSDQEQTYSYLSIGGKDYLVYLYRQVAKISNLNTSYKTTPDFYTKPATGEIITDSTPLSSWLGNVIPVSLATDADRYRYNFTFSNIGRFIKKSDKLTYTCFYDVTNDVTNPKKPEFFYRNISLNAFNPNNRPLGKNWSNEKGEKTKCEIEGGKYENGECNIPRDVEPESIYEEPEYSFTLTPENMQNIRYYNKQKEEEGTGYSDFNMTKYAGFDSDDENIWYTSNFLKEAANSNKYVQQTDESKGYTYKYEPKFTRWENSQGKLSGVGPAWK